MIATSFVRFICVLLISLGFEPILFLLLKTRVFKHVKGKSDANREKDGGARRPLLREFTNIRTLLCFSTEAGLLVRTDRGIESNDWSSKFSGSR
jgi:hypothetical protein